jgi:hypothetical protein
MTFHNPLHRFSLHDGARTLTLAMGDWAILVVDSSGRVLPLWILNHIHDDIIATHQFTPQNTFQLFDCFKNTAMWHGFLYSLSYETERRFLANHLEETTVNLQRLTFPSSVTFCYPYQHSQCWHHPSDHHRVAHVGWLVERMMSLPYDDATRFMENLIVDWLRIYSFDELPNNNGQLDTLDLRRGYMLYLMALEFETVALNSPDECARYFARYQKHEALKRRS